MLNKSAYFYICKHVFLNSISVRNYHVCEDYMKLFSKSELMKMKEFVNKKSKKAK
ncbi:hypothetical protein [Terrisporobacter sp.]